MKKTDSRIYNITLTGIFAALITIFTAYIGHIPVGPMEAMSTLVMDLYILQLQYCQLPMQWLPEQ